MDVDTYITLQRIEGKLDYLISNLCPPEDEPKGTEKK